MPFTKHDSRWPSDLQSPAACEQEAGWSEVLAHMPAELESRAREEKAFVRARKLSCAADLLRGLLAYVFGLCSFRQVGVWATVCGLSTMGERAWAKRMRAAQSWLWWLLTALLLQTEPHRPAKAVPRPILLVDASHLKEPGKSGKSWRIHLSYDLLAGRMQEVKFSEQKAENLMLFTPIKGAIRVADRGYCKREPIAAYIQAGEDVVVRLAWSSLPLQQPEGTAFDIGSYLEHLSADCQQFEESVWMQARARCFPLRLIGKRVSPEAAARERRARKIKAQQKGQQLQPTTLLLCDWIVVVTTLPASSWPAGEVLWLYRARWQIELLFKRIKQLLVRHAVQSHHAQSNQAVLAVLLVGWALVEEQAGALKVALLDDPMPDQLEDRADDESANRPRPASSWQVMAALVQSLRSMILGTWTWQQVWHSAKDLARLLTVQPQDRVHYESMLCQHFAADPPGGSPASFSVVKVPGS